MSKCEEVERVTSAPVATAGGPDQLVVSDRLGNSASWMRGLWADSAAFLVCSGPSLNALPFERLRDRGVLSLGVNNAAAYASTRAFVCGDPPEKFHQAIWLDRSMLKFLPNGLLGYKVRAKLDGSFRETKFRARDFPAVFGFDRSYKWDASTFLTGNSASWGRNATEAKRTGQPKVLFTMFLGLRILHWLGVRRCYLLGVDFRMRPGPRCAGNYAFSQRGAGGGNNDYYRAAIFMLAELRPILEADGFEVFNCNPESQLRVFPHVAFDEALDDCRGVFPPEPLDLSGWYEKPGESDADIAREDSQNCKVTQ